MATERRGRRGTARAVATALALPGWRATPAGAVSGGWLAAARDALAREIEARRLFPWIAVAFGVGILLAFAADGPLSPWPSLVGVALASCGAFAARGRLLALAALIAAAALFAGFAAAAIRMRVVEAPLLQRLTIARLGGFVEAIEERQAGARLVLRLVSLDGVAAEARPARARVSIRGPATVSPGDYVVGMARLLPPPEAARPGGYDFARDAYFRGIGAVGSISGRLTRAEPPSPPGLGLRWLAAVDRARNALTARIAGAIGGQPGAVAAALITGKRGLIDERTNDVLRAAGIYHVVSISGLHMVLAAGTVFWLARALMALSPALALGWPIKKIAAVIGMAGATAYCVFSGSDVATERALLMILVMQGAILVDRPALSLRNLALSALLVLAREPETLLGPSFQMSYAAVAGLIAYAEWRRGRRAPAEPGDPVRRVARKVGEAGAALIATTLIATLATGPFATFHFQNVQPYGLIGNAATLPLVSLAVMPAAVLGMLAYPFGLDRPVWRLMGLAVEAVLALSAWVAGLAGSVAVVPAFGGGALACLAAALLCLTLFATGLRVLALAPLALAAVAIGGGERPDIYVARDGSGAAVRGPDGRLALVGRVSAFTVEQWLKADGDARRPTDPSLTEAARCDTLGCTIVGPGGAAVAHALDRRAFAEDCRRAAIVVSRLAAPAGCGAVHVLDRAFLAARGAATLTATGSGFRMRAVREPGNARPWLPVPDAGRPAVALAAPAAPAGTPEGRAASGGARRTAPTATGPSPVEEREGTDAAEPPADPSSGDRLDAP